MPKAKTITIDGARVKACTGSDSRVSRLMIHGGERLRGCPRCERSYVEAACQTFNGTPVIPRHRAEVA